MMYLLAAQMIEDAFIFPDVLHWPSVPRVKWKNSFSSWRDANENSAEFRIVETKESNFKGSWVADEAMFMLCILWYLAPLSSSKWARDLHSRHVVQPSD